MMDFRQACNAVKTSAPKEVALMVTTDRELKKLCACWAIMTPLIQHPETAEPDPVSIWEGVTVDYEYLASMLGNSPKLAEALVSRARKLMLIYPDGTLHEYAFNACMADFMKQLGLEG